MKVLFFHLGDIHIRTKEDVILGRIQQIIDATKNLETDPVLPICVICGDLTYSGSHLEFALALEFLVSLGAGLTEHFNEKVRFVFVPGNHDCDISASSQARDLVLETVTKDPQTLTDESFRNICLQPLQRFFEFQSLFDGPEQVIGSERRLYAEHHFSLGSESVVIGCCNSAVLSKRHEQPGSLVVADHLIPKNISASVAVAVIHHPLHWLTPASASAVRTKLESAFDFVLTGHEHMLDRRQSAHGHATNMFLEGGVLQDNGDRSRSSFHTVIVDLSNKRQRHVQFTWRADHYEPVHADDPEQFNLWEEFAGNVARLNHSFEILPEFKAFINDPELTLTHRTRGELKLTDIYVFPDLRKVNILGTRPSKTVPGESVPDFVRKTACLFLAGDDLSGKTAFAKQMFIYLREQGDVPVYIDARKTPVSLQKFQEQIEHAVIAIYGSISLNLYRQVDRARRVIIIDNFHRLKLSGPHKLELLQKLRTHSFRVIVLAHELELTLQDVSEIGDTAADRSEISYFALLPMNSLRRNQLVEKWLLLSEHTERTAAAFVRTLEQLTRTLDTIVGKNYVPAFPAYVLSVLQATEAGTDIDIHASTHGYLYELFIKAAISKSASALTFNVLSVYLSHIAHWMFQNTTQSIPKLDLQQLHGHLHQELEVLPHFERQTEELVAARLLSPINDAFRFRHPYIYYYFLAVYLRDNIREVSVQETITNMSRRLYKTENANALLFLSHLSKDPFVVGAVLASAESQYNGVAPAALSEDVGFLNKLNAEVGRLAIPDKSVDERRKEALVAKDAETEEEDRFEVERAQTAENEGSLLARMNAALKTIQVLGQFLKNFPANFDKRQKDKIIETTTSLAQRALGDFLNLVQKHDGEMVRELAQLIAKRRPTISVEALRQRSTIAVVGICGIAAFGIVSRASYALGARELRTTYDRILPTSSVPFFRLLYVALQLDHYGDFPEALVASEAKALHDNPFTYCVLRNFVARHMALFPIEFSLRQRLAQQFQIDFTGVQNRPDQKLIRDLSR